MKNIAAMHPEYELISNEKPKEEYGTLSEQLNKRNGQIFHSLESTSLLMVGICMLLAETTQGFLYPTLWQFVNNLGGDKSSYTWSLASFYLGKLISSPLLGYWSDVSGSVQLHQSITLHYI